MILQQEADGEENPMKDILFDFCLLNLTDQQLSSSSSFGSRHPLSNVSALSVFTTEYIFTTENVVQRYISLLHKVSEVIMCSTEYIFCTQSVV